MADWGITGIPWMQKITEARLTTPGEYFGWHDNQNMHQRSIMGRISSDKTLSGEKFYSQQSGSGSNGSDSNNLWNGTGCNTTLQNGRNYNTCMFFGAGTDTSAFFDNNDYNYSANAVCSRALSVIGFGARWTCSGSFSDAGGDAQAYPEKVCLFYADPNNTFKRVVINANQKKSGNYTLGNKFSNNNTYYNSYLIPTDKINTVNTGNYIYMGMGIQFFHGSKASSHTSNCRMKNVRLICGDGTGLVDTPSRILICSYPSTELKNWQKEYDTLTPV